MYRGKRHSREGGNPQFGNYAKTMDPRIREDDEMVYRHFTRGVQ